MGRAVAMIVLAASLAVLLPFACQHHSSTGADAGIDAFVRCLLVSDSGVTYGCSQGGVGPGDRDDGGGAPLPPPPDQSPDAMNLPFGAECLFNAQCASDICFFYRVKGQFCTQLCTVDSDCPPASLGCSGQGVCRVGN